MSEIQELLEYVKGHTPPPWIWEYGGWDGVEMKTKEEFLRYCGECWDKTEAAGERQPHLHVVSGTDENGERVIVAIVGNGPRSESNAKVIINAPTMLQLLTEQEGE